MIVGPAMSMVGSSMWRYGACICYSFGRVCCQKLLKSARSRPVRMASVVGGCCSMVQVAASLGGPSSVFWGLLVASASR